MRRLAHQILPACAGRQDLHGQVRCLAVVGAPLGHPGGLVVGKIGLVAPEVGDAHERIGNHLPTLRPYPWQKFADEVHPCELMVSFGRCRVHHHSVVKFGVVELLFGQLDEGLPGEAMRCVFGGDRHGAENIATTAGCDA